MTIRKISTEDLVLIASLDWCKGSWHNQPHAEEITECDCVRLRNRKRLTENLWKVFMRLFRLCLAGTNLRVLHNRLAEMNLRVLHRRVAQMSLIDEFVDSTSKLLGSIMMSVSWS